MRRPQRAWRLSAAGRHWRSGVTLVEVVVVAFLAATAALAVFSLGQANVKLTQVNEEGFLARQVVLDLLEWYGAHPEEARLDAVRPQPLPGSFVLKHPVLADAFPEGDQIRDLFNKMNPSFRVEVRSNVEYPPGSGFYHLGLHYVVCTVNWTQQGTRPEPRTITMSRLLAEMP